MLPHRRPELERGVEYLSCLRAKGTVAGIQEEGVRSNLQTIKRGESIVSSIGEPESEDTHCSS